MKLSLVAALLSAVATPAFAVGQLPGGVTPLSYDIMVRPDAKAMTFSGEETVAIEVAKTSRTIVLNAADLKISRATLDGKPVTFRLDTAKQQLVLTSGTAVSAGKHALAFAWTGTINTSAAGLFAIDYTNKDGSAARMLVTQFEAPDARRFAPLWDEPAYKARFTISTVAPGDQTAFSNMPATSVTRQADGSKLYRFAETPKMSSYLMFLGMGDVERKTVMAGKTEIGIITRRGVVDQGDYSLAQAKRLLTYYNDYFGQPYPLPKLDMIAGPGSSQFFGAMENWGAIFYFEPELLYDAKRATQSGKQRIFTVVAHEMAHQWFGDLVTMNWWDDLWLNEGFASWMENKSSIDLNPEWHADATAVAQDREGALQVDSTVGTHPIIRHVETVDQIGQAFDGITYMKGQAVIGMLESTLGADTFRAGIRGYMAKYKYGNTVTDQLWSELSTAANTPVAPIAHDFTLQPGVPLVTMTDVRCVGGQTQVSLTQGRFAYDTSAKQTQTWRVPMTLGVIGQADVRATVRGVGVQPVTVPGCGTVVLNRGKGSYTRTVYTAPAHAAIVRDFGRLALTDQLGTLGDDFALAKGGNQRLDRYFADVGALGTDANPLLWQTVAGQLSDLGGRVPKGAARDAVSAKIIRTIQPAMARVGFAASPGEGALTATLRETLISVLGDLGDPAVLERSRTLFAALQKNPDAIPAPIRAPILGAFAQNASAADWDALLALTLAEKNPVTKNSYVRLLGVVKDDALARRALDLLTTDRFTAPQKASLLRTVANEHPDMAFDYAVAHLALVNTLVETSTRAGFVAGLGAGSDDPAMPGKIKAFATANLPAEARGAADRTVSTMAARRMVDARISGDVAAWGRSGS
ncbi:M1 family metallopeptidase [Sphingomonas sp. PAMC 26617]|uniref:M1 family metallopeptidase n=1 Tax=Sphingomonas sp. PAMC 26617 TaxID=1112216 RepID=UPI00031AE577|nr:M1 family metallopeptidase [Sphingomonas sp. PAMC 26617]